MKNIRIGQWKENEEGLDRFWNGQEWLSQRAFNKWRSKPNFSHRVRLENEKLVKEELQKRNIKFSTKKGHVTFEFGDNIESEDRIVFKVPSMNSGQFTKFLKKINVI